MDFILLIESQLISNWWSQRKLKTWLQAPPSGRLSLRCFQRS